MSSFLDPDVPAELVSRAMAGEVAAHERLFRRFHQPVFNLARRMLASEAAADEVVQDTFVEVLRKISTYRADAPLGGWIRRIAVNFCLMQLRSAWYRRALPLSVVGETAGHEDPSRAGPASDLSRALACLPARTRAVVWLHDVEGMTHREIGAAMGKTASFSKSQLARAHERLRGMLAEARDTQQCMQVSNSY